MCFYRNSRKIVPLIFVLMLLLSSSFAGKKPNILFIAVDDLKPVTGAYGDKLAKTPGLDKLAAEGIMFMNSYCQQAVCAASRASLLTGMHPDKTRVWDLVTDFRQVNPKAVSLPQYLRQNGYETTAMGKIFHKTSAGPGHDSPSWSIPYSDPDCKTYVMDNKINDKGKGAATECADVPDSAYHDGKMTDLAIKMLGKLSRSNKPFFFAVGYLKPHLPFVAPKKYWDLYDRNMFTIAPFQKQSHDSPEIAYHVSSELKSYTDIPDFDSYSTNSSKWLPVKKQKELIHGYYAAMSYTDAQILRLLSELEKLGIRKKTIVVVWGDHGWHLGDHGLWNKHSNFEQATHTLLMMSVPEMKQGIKPVTMCEFTDIFPTLCDLAGIEKPNYLDGVSLLPAMDKPEINLRVYSMSQYPRGKDKMGYSIRTSRFRYTEWFDNGFKTNQLYDKKYIIGREMYDYQKDPLEKENVVNKPEYARDLSVMENLFQECMLREFQTCEKFNKLADYQEPVNTNTLKKSK